jgi:hypothetical protein
MEAFVTTTERLEAERLEAQQQAIAEKDRAERERRNADLHRQWAEKMERERLEAAQEQEAQLANEGRQRQAQLDDARNRVAVLEAAIASERELHQLEAEAADLQRAIIGKPLTEAQESDTARLVHLESLIALWPSRRAFLEAQLAAAKMEVRSLESTLDVIKRKFSEASKALADILKKSPATETRAFTS